MSFVVNATGNHAGIFPGLHGPPRLTLFLKRLFECGDERRPLPLGESWGEGLEEPMTPSM